MLAKVKCQQLEIDEIGLKLKKSKGVDEGMELRNRFDQLVREKDFAIVNKGKQLIEYEEKTKEVLAKVNGLEQKVDELSGKDAKVVEGKKSAQTLIKENERLSSKFSNDYQLLKENKREIQLLMAKLELFKNKAGRPQEELQKKTHEIEEGRKVQAQLQQQIDWDNTEMLKNKQQLREYEKEKNLLIERMIGLKLRINELMVKS